MSGSGSHGEHVTDLGFGPIPDFAGNMCLLVAVAVCQHLSSLPSCRALLCLRLSGQKAPTPGWPW